MGILRHGICVLLWFAVMLLVNSLVLGWDNLTRPSAWAGIGVGMMLVYPVYHALKRRRVK